LYPLAALAADFFDDPLISGHFLFDLFLHQHPFGADLRAGRLVHRMAALDAEAVALALHPALDAGSGDAKILALATVDGLDLRLRAANQSADFLAVLLATAMVAKMVAGLAVGNQAYQGDQNGRCQGSHLHIPELADGRLLKARRPRERAALLPFFIGNLRCRVHRDENYFSVRIKWRSCIAFEGRSGFGERLARRCRAQEKVTALTSDDFKFIDGAALVAAVFKSKSAARTAAAIRVSSVKPLRLASRKIEQPKAICISRSKVAAPGAMR
jgi:hypothetical protein